MSIITGNVSDQLEFHGLPNRTAPPPVETSREFKQILVATLSNLTAVEKVKVCHELLDASYFGQPLQVVSAPLRIVAGHPQNALSGRKVLLERPLLVETILSAHRQAA